MEKPHRYYFDSDVLILLDRCGLTGKLERFKRRTGTELIITTTVKNELEGARHKQPTTRHDMPASIRNAMRAGIITMVDDESDEKARGIRAKHLGLDRGEASLFALMESDGARGTEKPVLVTNDAKAYKKAKEMKIKGCNIGELLQYLCRDK